METSRSEVSPTDSLAPSTFVGTLHPLVTAVTNSPEQLDYIL